MQYCIATVTKYGKMPLGRAMVPSSHFAALESHEIWWGRRRRLREVRKEGSCGEGKKSAFLMGSIYIRAYFHRKGKKYNFRTKFSLFFGVFTVGYTYFCVNIVTCIISWRF